MCGEEAAKTIVHGLEKISLEGIRAQKLHRQLGRAEERAEGPRELRAKEQIAREPRQHHALRDAASAHPHLHACEVQVSRRECVLLATRTL